METQQITFERSKALELYRAYKKHQHYSQPIDDEIRRAYQLIAQGRLIIRAIDSIIAAGLNDEGLPKLALVRADAAYCIWRPQRNGGGEFRMADAKSFAGWRRRENEHFSRSVAIPAGTWPQLAAERLQYRAQTPLVPINLRPKRGIENYHILFEAEWTAIPAKDPLLLRRIGQADLWLVAAAWDLTDIERAALAARIRA